MGRRQTSLGWLYAALLLPACTGDACNDSHGDDPDPGSLPLIPLAIATIAPTQGPTTGGTTVTLTGSGFQASQLAAVEFGGTAGTALVVTSDTLCTVTTPIGVAGAVAVTARGTPPGLVATEAGGFLYLAGAPPAPSVTAVAPTFGLTVGGTLVTLTGTGFQTGATVAIGPGAASGVIVNGASRCTATTPPGSPGAVAVTLTNPDAQNGALPSGYTYVSPNAQTAAYVFDTAVGIDCRRRWYINFNHASFLKDLQNLGLQTWGTPGDTSVPPATPGPVDLLALDWVRAYTLRTLNICYGRNGDGTKVASSSLNVTFVGLPPGTGSVGCANAATDFAMMCVGGCDPGGNGGPHPSATQTACTLGALGAAVFDNFGGGSCNQNAEQDCDGTYHVCGGGCGATGTGIFASLIVNTWGQTLPGGKLTAADLPILDGTTTSGARYMTVHGFMANFGRRIAFILAHECGHSMGLVASSTTGGCSFNTTIGLCNASPAHNDCCGTNIMQSSATFLAFTPLTDTSAAFSGQPGSVSASSACSAGGISSWALLTAFCGISP